MHVRNSPNHCVCVVFNTEVWECLTYMDRFDKREEEKVNWTVLVFQGNRADRPSVFGGDVDLAALYQLRSKGEPVSRVVVALA